MKKWMLNCLILGMVLALPALAMAGQNVLIGHKPAQTTVFDSVSIASTAADTSDWIVIGDSQYHTLFVAADSIGGGGVVDVDISYELSRNGTDVAWPVGNTAGEVLSSGFTGYDFQEYYIAIQAPMTLYIRFIAIGTATNAAYTKLKGWLWEQP